MKPYLLPLTLVVSLTLSLNVSATVHYVDLNSTNPVVPYTNWLTAATNIQDAISFASSSDTVLVTNGVYQTGGGSSRVSLGTGRTLQSVNGPAFTTIKGYQVPGTTNGPGSVRCAYLSGGAMLSGFTLTNGSASGNAGGVYCESVSATISNCVIVGNAASGNGGAVYQGTFINCTLANNVLLSGGWGGAAYYSVLINCRLTGNLSSYRGGGSGFSYLTNCVLSGNRAGSFGGATDGSTLVNCTVTGNTAHEAGGGCSGDRLFNCIVYYNNIELPNTALSNYIASLNMTNCCTSPLPFYGTGNITNPPFFANPVGGDYHLNAASPCINAGINAFVTNVIDLDGNPRVVAGTVDMGAYEFPAPIHYVNLQNHAPVSPYTNWATAATGIQDAVDAATNSDLILVTNGIYQTGSRVVPIFDDSTPNRLAVTKAVTVQSVNGALATIIQGYRPSTGTGDNAIRCLYLTNGASLFGFTLTNGATHTIAYESPNGGGVYCPSTAAVLSNCVICGCNSGDLGGGAYRGTLYSCTLSRNHSSNGGASYSSTLSDCTLLIRA